MKSKEKKKSTTVPVTGVVETKKATPKDHSLGSVGNKEESSLVQVHLKDGPKEQALVPAQQMPVTMDPTRILDEASNAARQLQEILRNKPKKVVFNNEQYLEFEDWQTLGQFYGVTVRVPEGGTNHVEFSGSSGWEAHADLVDFQGNVIGGADAMCLNDERNWSRKPQFQLRSMAQTRACAKALRNRLAWVAVLAGFRPTPAEEMEDVNIQSRGQPSAKRSNVCSKEVGKPVCDGRRNPVFDPSVGDEGTVSSQEAQETLGAKDISEEKITEAQRRKFFACYKQAGVTDEQAKAHLKKVYGIDSTKDILQKDFNNLLESLPKRQS